MAAPATTNDRAPGEGFLVLWAGGSEIAERDAQVELRRADGMRVEACPLNDLIARANERAPDLIVLGAEAGDSPETLVTRLGATSPASAIPVIAIASTGGAPPKIRARHGLVARVDAASEPARMATQIADLVRTLADRAPVWKVESKSGDIEEAATRFAIAARSGLVAAEGGGAIAVDAGGTIAKGPDKLHGDVYFYERPAGRVVIVTQAARLDEPAAALEGVRVLVIDDDHERRDQIAKRLERSSAQTRATGTIAQAVHASRALDPTIVVITADALSAPAISPLWTEPRLASASVLVLDGDALANAALAPWIGIAAALCRPEITLRRRLRNKEALADRLETLGAARWLKLLGRCDHEVTLRVFGSAGRARVDLDGGRIQGAAMRPSRPDGQTGTDMLEGRAAVDALMTMSFGRVLAGPPGALAALDGSRAGRKPSAVGQLERAAPTGVRRKHGLVAEEVVVRTTDATSMRPPSLAARGELRSVQPPKAEPAVTSPAKAPAPVPPPEDDEPEITARPEKRASSMSMSTTPPPLRKKPMSVAPSIRKIESERPPKLEPARAQKVEDAAAAGPNVAPEDIVAAGPRPARAAPRDIGSGPRPARDAPRDLADAAPRPVQSVPATPITAPPRKNSANNLWLGAGVLLALGVGGYAAWRMYLSDREEPVRIALRAPEPADPMVSAPPDDPELPEEEPAVARAEPVAEEPVAAEPIVQPAEPVAEEPIAEEPVAQEPAAIADVAALLEQAQEAATARRFEESEALARRAHEASPQSPEAAYRLALALHRQNRGAEAAEWAQRAAELEPDEARALALAGDIYIRMGRFNSAARAYRAALDREENFGAAQRGLENLARRGITP
jgi:hypothetical protein